MPAPAQWLAAPTHALLPPPLGSAGIPSPGQPRYQPRPELPDATLGPVRRAHARAPVSSTSCGSPRRRRLPSKPRGGSPAWALSRARSSRARKGWDQLLSPWHVVCRQKAICLLIFGLYCRIFFSRTSEIIVGLSTDSKPPRPPPRTPEIGLLRFTALLCLVPITILGRPSKCYFPSLTDAETAQRDELTLARASGRIRNLNLFH